MAFDNKTAIVTGSSRGIGAAIAQRLARAGFNIVVNYANDPAPAETIVAGIQEADGRAIAVAADIGDPAAMASLFDAAETAFGGVDVLINNAGIMRLAPVADTADADWHRMIATNLTGAFNGLREAARRLRDGGRVVSFSSSTVGLYPPTYGAYVATKAAVEAISRVLAKELGARGITVNVVAPGPVATDLFLTGKTDADIAPLVARTPLGRLGAPDDIAGTVAFLVSGDGGWVNGQVVRANGGIV